MAKLSKDQIAELNKIAKSIVEGGRGLLAADESNGTCGKRFADIGVENTEENRRTYREYLFTTPEFEKYCGGVILFEETLFQKTAEGMPFATLLASKNVVPGIKVDTGPIELAGATNEKVTEGLDGLRERFAEYHKAGARFAKWRSVIEIDSKDRPSDLAIEANAEATARYAALAQEAGIVPIVEPEILMDGDHSIEVCDAASHRVLKVFFEKLALHNVALEGILLKPNMVISGKKCATQATSEEIAKLSVACYQKQVPAEVPGIVFLSGGQGEVEATENLNAINKVNGDKPWVLTFSYGRALQQGALRAWMGKESNKVAMQDVFAHRAHMNWLAANGNYTAETESKTAA